MSNKPSIIHVVLCEPGKWARITTINHTLADLQQIVGGYIEVVYPFDDPVAIICNEEGKISGLELNRSLRDESGNVYDILAGTFLIVGLGEEDFTSLSTEHQEKYRKMFEVPEIFLAAQGSILAIKVDEGDE